MREYIYHFGFIFFLICPVANSDQINIEKVIIQGDQIIQGNQGTVGNGNVSNWNNKSSKTEIPSPTSYSADNEICNIMFANPARVKVGDEKQYIKRNYNLFLLDDGVIFGSNNADITDVFLNAKNPDDKNARILAKINNLQNISCKYGFIDIPRILSVLPQAEAARNKFKLEFSEWDKTLVQMKKEVEMGHIPIETFNAEQNRFTNAFNKRRNEELRLLQIFIVSVIKRFSEKYKYDLIITEMTDDYKIATQSRKVPDITEYILNEASIN